MTVARMLQMPAAGARLVPGSRGSRFLGASTATAATAAASWATGARPSKPIGLGQDHGEHVPRIEAGQGRVWLTCRPCARLRMLHKYLLSWGTQGRAPLREAS